MMRLNPQCVHRPPAPWPTTAIGLSRPALTQTVAQKCASNVDSCILLDASPRAATSYMYMSLCELLRA